MKRIVFCGNMDEKFNLFFERIRNKQIVYACVNDAFEYEKYKAAGVDACLSSQIPIGLPDINEIVVSTGNYEGKIQIIKKILGSYNFLPTGGELWVITTRKTGATTILKIIQEFDLYVTKKHFKEFILLNIKKKIENLSFDEVCFKLGVRIINDISEKILDYNFCFSTEATLFSKEGADKGSLFLLNSISVEKSDTVLDYGCGYGVLGIVIAKIYEPIKVDFVDIKTEAKDKTVFNIEKNKIITDHRVFLSTKLDSVYNNYTLIVSHFPIHVPTKTKYDMLEECKKALKVDGRLTCVIPQNYNFEKMIMNVFGNYKIIAKSDSDGYYIFSTQKICDDK